MRWPVLAALAVLAACGGKSGDPAAPSPAATAAAVATLPPGAEGAIILRGENLVRSTKKLLPTYVGANLACEACHIQAGRQPGPLSFVGIYGQYPQYSARTKHFIGLRDRIAECFLYSMNGEPPTYYGPDLIAIEAYIGFLSRGVPVGPAPPTPAFRDAKIGDVKAGTKIYSAQCMVCHGAKGAGNVAAGFPPLWGSTSFNDRAGMTRIMPRFVQANMPLGRGGTLTAQEAADVAAYVLSHKRPHFDPARLANISSTEAAFFR